MIADTGSTGATNRVRHDALSPTDTPIVRLVGANEILFRTGERKVCLYRVETGCICLYGIRQDARPRSIEFASPGDVIGLGFLDSHACEARAIIDTRLVPIPLASLGDLVAHDPPLQARLSTAIEREFEFLRARAVRSGQKSLSQRIAAFLVSASRINVQEGRDPAIVIESCPSGFIADLLGMDVGSLASILCDLERQGLIEPGISGGLRLTDIETLELIAAARVSGTRKVRAYH